MNMNQHIVTTACPAGNAPPGNARLFRSHCSGAFLDHIRRAALPAVMLAVAVVLATGCSSTGPGFNARLISPMPNNQQATNSEDDNWYQPARNPGLDPERIESGAFAPPEGEW
jgi:hypothetical protein